MLRYVSPIFDENDNAYDASQAIQMLGNRFGLNEGLKHYTEWLDRNGLTPDLLRNPERLHIPLDFSNLFSEVVLSPGTSDEEEARVRQLVSEHKFNSEIRRADHADKSRNPSTLAPN